ncbi:hypothetical protein ACFFKU_01305 [Kineococcus gynurae]|uniref:LGFP repeat-containing protein n=1 Tax=Kineococcus gynurae TaxID=452979 RepID=A0ABV5LQ20_9ACTN
MRSRRARTPLVLALALAPLLGTGPLPAHALTGEELVGTVVRIADSGTDGSPTTYLDLGDGAGFDLRAVGNQRLDRVAPGSEVTVRVSDADADTLRVLSVQDVSAPARPQSTGSSSAPHTVRIAMVVPAGAGQDANPMTAQDAENSLAAASQYWSDQTEGKVSFTLAAPVTGWYTSTYPCSDVGNLWNEAAARTGWTGAAREHLVVVVPRQAYTSRACDAYGKGTIGSSSAANGALYVTDTASSLWAHELGHNLSLNHANAVYCSASADVTWNGSTWGCGCASCTGTWVSYGDWFDVMGPSGQLGYGSLGVAGQSRLGLQTAGIRTVGSAGSYTVAALPVRTDGAAHGLRIPDPAGRGTYFVELRGNWSGDARSSASLTSMPRGVRITKADDSQSGGSVVLDATPTGSSTDRNWILTAGSTFTSASGQVRITTTTVDGTSATVQVALGAETPTSTPTSTPTAAPTSAPTSTPTATPTSTPTRTTSPTGTPTTRPTSNPTTRPTTTRPTSSPTPTRPPSRQLSPVTERPDGTIAVRRGDRTVVVRGAILQRYRAAGLNRSSLGLPVTDEIPLRGGAFTRFEHGSIYWSPLGGAHVVKGAIRDRWASLGWENSTLGYPTGEETAVPGGVVQTFQHGSITYSFGTGRTVVTRG